MTSYIIVLCRRQPAARTVYYFSFFFYYVVFLPLEKHVDPRKNIYKYAYATEITEAKPQDQTVNTQPFSVHILIQQCSILEFEFLLRMAKWPRKLFILLSHMMFFQTQKINRTITYTIYTHPHHFFAENTLK